MSAEILNAGLWGSPCSLKGFFFALYTRVFSPPWNSSKEKAPKKQHTGVRGQISCVDLPLHTRADLSLLQYTKQKNLE